MTIFCPSPETAISDSPTPFVITCLSFTSRLCAFVCMQLNSVTDVRTISLMHRTMATNHLILGTAHRTLLLLLNTTEVIAGVKVLQKQASSVILGDARGTR